MLQEELQCVCLILFLGGGESILFSYYTYVCMYGLSIKSISVTVRVTVDCRSVKSCEVFSEFKLFSNVSLELKVTVLSYILVH
jgi:hypothetical protein